jgi:hypothetical protein
VKRVVEGKGNKVKKGRKRVGKRRKKEKKKRISKKGKGAS